MYDHKHQIISHYERSIVFVESLADITEEQWRTPIEPGKWSVAEIIGHLTPWDAFVLNQRLPFLFTKESLPKGPDVEEMNTNAARNSRAQSKEETIADFIRQRRQLIDALYQIVDQQWQQPFTIGASELTLHRYFASLVDHDLHHFSQVREFLRM
ncbi:DinB family protein [Lysinibacillus sp. BPa_S21]|uniref:DinB family protein n=1 Tax=Lysinibacillus sp. BPa_S21 TaxID=2932478 RepID=UPI00201224D2|nr:DinB family protein [Lysinibacillus sp. BPa_S21]MCL1697183.1 DinB family protein [Lysinibacillus sp. BPa_S21]